MNPLRALGEYRAMREFESSDRAWRNLVFYSEGSGDWPHIGPVVTRLVEEHDRKVTYLSSDPADPGLHVQHPNLRAIQIGSGTARTILFARLDCDVFVMTLPDLGSLWLKRSVHPVRYIYLFHSMNSIHAAYRTGAFDHYDAVLCVGAYHVDEIRATEQHYGLKPKELVEHGSVKLDSVRAAVAEAGGQSDGAQAGRAPRVLVAPTWGESSLIERPEGMPMLEVLAKGGMDVTVRLHPMTVRRRADIVEGISALARRHGTLTLERDMNATRSWLQADVMVGDWSGAAIEFAFATGKPVISVDTPPKVMNPEWEAIGRPTFESSVRNEIGQVVPIGDLGTLPDLVEAILRPGAERRPADQVMRSSVFNVGRSAPVAATYLDETSRRRS